MCPNCFNTIAIAPSLLLGAGLGGAGSALLGASLAAARLRFRTSRAPRLTESNTEETES
jgi:hypothetical protein